MTKILNTYLVQYSVQSRKSGTFLSKPKTDSSVCVVKLPEDALEAVKIYMDHLKRKEGLRFRTSTGGLIHPGNVVRAFKHETKKAGLPSAAPTIKCGQKVLGFVFQAKEHDYGKANQAAAFSSWREEIVVYETA